MNRSMLTAVLMALAPLAPAAAADVAGDWKIEGTIGQMPVSIVCTLKEAEQKLSGTCRNDEVGELPLTGEAQDDKASWTYNVNFQGQQFTVSYNGALASETQMKGDILVAGAPTGAFTGTKL